MGIVQALIHDAVVTESTVMDLRHLNNSRITDMTYHLFLAWSGVLVAVQDILDELSDKGTPTLANLYCKSQLVLFYQ